MKFHEKLQKLRKEKNLSQESLAEMLDVSRQAISKWESGQSYPEMEKLMTLSDIFGVTLDSFVKDGELQDDKENKISTPYWTTRGHVFEYKSERKLFGLPLVHVHVGLGMKRAKGVIAIGNMSTGILSIGLVAKGILSIGLLSIGFIGFGLLALGLIALGVISVGVFSIGAIAFGVFTLGALSIGMFSVGACAVATHIAIGDHAYGHIAIGRVVSGTVTFIDTSSGNVDLSMISGEEVRRAIFEEYPNMWNWIVRMMTMFLG